MRILYVLNSGDPGGMEQHVLDLINGMYGRGHDVFVWCNEGLIVGWYEKAGAQVTKEKIGFDVDPFYILRLNKFLKKEKIDVVHAHELKAATNSLLAGSLAKTEVKITHTHTPISEWQDPKIKKIPTYTGYALVVNHFADYEIALTRSRQRAKIKEGIKSEKLTVIPNGLDVSGYELSETEKAQYKKEICEKFIVPQNKFIFGNVSRLTEEKGHKDLITAFHKIQEYKEVDEDDIHLLIAGGGRLNDELTKLVNSLDLQDKVTITGRFSEEDHLKLYAAFDSFIFPSLAEGFGIVLIEAMAMGLPIICSNLEVLEEVGGSAVFSYFETGDSQNLAEKMHQMYIKRDILENVSKNAIERVETLYTLEKFVDNHENLYLDLLGRN